MQRLHLKLKKTCISHVFFFDLFVIHSKGSLPLSRNHDVIAVICHNSFKISILYVINHVVGINLLLT
jgi:hypothetical protein